jgi:hypothetical protein
MKKLFLISVLSIIPIMNCNAQNITGKWHWQNKSGSAMFSLTLEKTTNNTIKGYHCAVAQNGKRIDCDSDSSDDDYSVSLMKLQENVYIGTIFSNYSATKSTYKLIYRPSNDTILFQRVKKGDGITFIPKKVVLHRE